MTPGTREIDLQIEGMTCASCAARVERSLNRLPGVQASVNYATERAHVVCVEDTDEDTLTQAVQKSGYEVRTQHEHGGHQHEDYSLAQLRSRLIGAAILTPLIVALSMVPALQFRGWQWVVLLLATPVVIWAAWPFHVATVRNARHGASSMDTLVSIGITASYLWSVWALVFGGAGELGMRMHVTWLASSGTTDEIYFEVAAAVTLFLLAGRYLEARAKVRSSAALQRLLEMGAKDVAVLGAGAERRVPIEELRVGDVFVVRPGGKVATDGVVLRGTSAVDMSLLTGEPMPIDVGPGDPVVGATINSYGALEVRATRVGADTQLAQIGRLVERAQTGKAPVQRLADRVSAVFVPVVFGIAAVTLLGWLAFGGTLVAALTAAVAVLIVACPCALGLATPTALLVGTGRGAELGILIRGPEVLESTRAVDTVVLDKTGTVTAGEMSVSAVRPVTGWLEEDVLRLAGSAEQGSEHPIAVAIMRAARERLGRLDDASGFRATPGEGIEAVVADHVVRVGRPSGTDADPAVTAVSVTCGGTPIGTIVVADPVKPSSADAVRELRGLGLRPMLLTGDNAAVAHRVARQIEIADSDVRAEVRPEGKVAAIESLQRDGRVVAMVGDGVNDAAALAQADLGVAMGTGSDVAIEASDLTVVRGDVRLVPQAIRLARATLRTIKANLFWAFAYNVAAIPLAAFGLLNPLIAGFAMAASSVFVVTNSLRLRRFS